MVGIQTVNVPNVQVPLDRPWNTEQAAAYLGFDYETTRRLIKRGDIPGRKVGRQYRVLKESVDRWLSGRKP